MRWRDALEPVSMQRIALAAPDDALRDLLVTVADEGSVELDLMIDESVAPQAQSARARMNRLRTPGIRPALSPTELNLDLCEEAGRVDLIAGEADLERHAAQVVRSGGVVALLGWTPSPDLGTLQERLGLAGCAAIPLPRPEGAEPPTLLAGRGASGEFAPLVETYATVPYADINPTVIAGLAYVLMFGMMFADVGHGALLLLMAVLIRRLSTEADATSGIRKRVAKLRPAWLFLAGAGLASVVFGALYGECFGPTGLVPVLWLNPLDHPVALLGAAVAVGAVMLSGAYALGTVNRFREGGWRRAVYAPSGLAGAGLFLGLGVLGAAIYADSGWVVLLGTALVSVALVVAWLGLFAAAGGGGTGGVQASVELFDLVIRLGANLVSFARLAAFGLTHAALGDVIWQATSSAAHHGAAGVLGAVVLFVGGNVLTFALEGLVAAIQALRLEYYELFSRVFEAEGRPFRPWHVPLTQVEVPC